MRILAALLAAFCLAMSGCKALEALDASLAADTDERDSSLNPKEEGWNPPHSVNVGEDSSF